MAVDLTRPSRPPSDLSDKFMLRLPDGMRDRLKAVAEANKRSMNAEIVARLEASLQSPTERFAGTPGFADGLEAIADRLVEAVGMARETGRTVSVDIRFGTDEDRTRVIMHRDDLEGAN